MTSPLNHQTLSIMHLMLSHAFTFPSSLGPSTLEKMNLNPQMAFPSLIDFLFGW